VARWAHWVELWEIYPISAFLISTRAKDALCIKQTYPGFVFSKIVPKSVSVWAFRTTTKE
jgi:hypothetical protein